MGTTSDQGLTLSAEGVRITPAPYLICHAKWVVNAEDREEIFYYINFGQT